MWLIAEFDLATPRISCLYMRLTLLIEGVVYCSFHRLNNMELKLVAANEGIIFLRNNIRTPVIGERISEIILH